jgi:hypothetical protein
VSWTAASGATSYQVFRNAVNDPTTATQVAATSGSPATDTTAAANPAYFYWVRATNTCGSSPLTGGDPGSALGTPAAPAGVQAADGASCNGIAVTWNAAAGASDYRVWRNASPTMTGATQVGTTTTTSFDDTTAPAGVTLHYFVDAGNACGRGATVLAIHGATVAGGIDRGAQVRRVGVFSCE